MVIALLAILKAGGAYVPIDPGYPPERIYDFLQDAQVPLLITEKKLLSSLPKAAVEKFCLDDIWAATGDLDIGNLSNLAAPGKLIYVIYTSGSTGKPKGVQIEHRSVVNLLMSMRRTLGLEVHDVLVAVTTLSFDIAGLEMYLPLIVGAKLVVADRETTHDGRELLKLLKNSSATVMQATPATWRLLMQAGWKGNGNFKTLCGGEALPAELARELIKRSASVWNLYGPTETTIWSTIYRVKGNHEGVVPIGRPIANTELYVLDSDRNPVGPGVEGELYIGGDGLARGYFARPELTAERFVPHPFSSKPGARLYRTGDLARYGGDGIFEFVGRIDHQVKIRGFRIELGEIEAVLERHTGVRQAIVMAREDVPGDKRLVAYVVPNPIAAPNNGALRSHLMRALPDYMIPSAFVQVEKLPQTLNGKIDRRSLPAPKPTDFDLSADCVAPRDRVEASLAKLWEEVLGIRPIGVRTSFFELGAHSLLAAQLFIKISKEFGKDLPLTILFQAPTIEQLAKFVRSNAVSANFPTLVTIQSAGSKPAFFCVHGGAGSTLFLHPLARHLGTDQPFYGFESEGTDGRRVQRPRLEQMAKHYISEMRRFQPDGPYYIGGYCFGGLVAFEMAQQLLQQGQRAAIVAMFNSPLRFNRPVPKPRVPTPREKLTHYWQKFSQLTLTEKLPYASKVPKYAMRQAMKRIWSWRLSWESKVCRLFLRLNRPVPGFLRRMYVHRMTGAAERGYIPKFYPGPISLFRGAGLYDDDPEMGWTGLSPSLEIHEIDGGHGPHVSRRVIMHEPLVPLLAEQLRLSLERARASVNATCGERREKESVRTALVENWVSDEVTTAIEPA